MHWPFAELADKHDGQDIKKTVEHALPSKLTVAKFAGLVDHDFLPDLAKAGPFGKHGDIAMHFAVDLDVFDHFITVGFQPAIEIMQFDLTGPTGDRIEQFRG